MEIQEEIVSFLRANKGKVLTKPEIALGLAHWRVDSLLDSECADWVKDPVGKIDREYQAILKQLEQMRLRDLQNVRRYRVYH